MDESLRKWCRQSFKSLRRGEVPPKANSSPGTPAYPAESIVDWAAFRKLLSVREITASLPLPDFHSAEVLPPRGLESLVERCPLDETSRPEILGEIHELLVSLRGDSGQTDRKRPRSSVRKRTGTFYTPQPIVDEILRLTLDERLEKGTTADALEHSLLDPAAGCGAFLVAAYRRLLAWYLRLLVESGQTETSVTLIKTKSGPHLSFDTCRQILLTHLYGVDFDAAAIEVARRILWLVLLDSSAPETRPTAQEVDWHFLESNFKQGHSLIGATFSEKGSIKSRASPSKGVRTRISPFDWPTEFPGIKQRGGFDLVVGNPPYRRERDYKRELDLIQRTRWGRHHQSARMDLWYYFVFRGIHLLKEGGTLSYITNAYWLQGSGSSKLIAALREQVRVDEILLLRNTPVFPRVTGQHVIFKLTRGPADRNTVIRIAGQSGAVLATSLSDSPGQVIRFEKSRSQLFHGDRIDVFPSHDGLLTKLKKFPRLGELGEVRQGIAENPATLNRRTLVRFPKPAETFGWIQDEGVFSLTPAEVGDLGLTPAELSLLRPYHDLCDLDRYRCSLDASRQLIYSTPATCPDIEDLPNLKKHLTRFRDVLEARRETQRGTNSWWHLHWPREERVWLSDKLIILQMAVRPSIVPVWGACYVPFSTNVWVPRPQTREHLNYVCAVLNSRVLWAWFANHSKRRGIGLELNGHVLKQAPVPRIDFSDLHQRRCHDELVQLVDLRLGLSQNRFPSGTMEGSDELALQQSVEFEIDLRVQSLFELDPSEVGLVEEILGRESI